MALKKLNRLKLDLLRPPNVWPPPPLDGAAAAGPPPPPAAPRVRPGVWNEAPGAAVLASLTAFSTASVRARGSAPRTRWCSDAPLKMMKVGMAVTLWAEAMDCWLSTLTLQKVILPGLAYLVDSDSKVGAITLQGPHQSA